MAFRSSQSASEMMFADGRCVVCRQGLDRAGRSCAKCLRSRQLKLFFALVVVAQCAAVGIFIAQSRRVNAVVPSSGMHTVEVSPRDKTGWYYFDITDPLIEDVTHHARLNSDTPSAATNASASAGATTGTMEVSFSRHYGKSVLLTFPLVPQACLANVCELRALFDNDAPQVLAYQDISSHGATVFLLTQPGDFLKRLPSAHDLTFIASLGTPVDTTITFDVRGYHLQMAALGSRFRAAQLTSHA